MWNNIRQFFNPKAPEEKITDPPDYSPVTPPILYSLQQASSEPISYYSSSHNVEVLLLKSSEKFLVIALHSLWSRWSNGPHEEWRTEADFNDFAAAQKEAYEILLHPFERGKRSVRQNQRHFENDRNKSSVYTTKTIYERPANFVPQNVLTEILLGTAESLPDGLEACEVVPLLWQSRAEERAHRALRNFAGLPVAKIFRYGYWGMWKWLYKEAEAAQDNRLLGIMLARLDEIGLAKTASDFPLDYNSKNWLERGPSVKTLEYMKRRGRRYLRNLRKVASPDYVPLAKALIQEAATRKGGVNPVSSWLTFDLLYYASKRYEQTGHSQGPYRLQNRRPHLIYKDPSAALWATETEFLQKLYTGANTAWQIAEWSYLTLKNSGQTLPPLTTAAANNFLSSDSLTLVRLGVQKLLTELDRAKKYKPESLATAFWYANATQRKRLLTLAPELGSQSDKFKQSFSTRLNAIANLEQRLDNNKKISGRFITLSLLLIDGNFPLREWALTIMVSPVVTAQNLALLEKLIDRIPLNYLDNIFSNNLQLPAALREVVTQTLVKYWTGKQVTYYYLRNLIIYGDMNWSLNAGWRLLEVVKTGDEQPGFTMWNDIFGHYQNRDNLIRQSLANPAAFKYLLKYPQLLERLQRLSGGGSGDLFGRMEWNALKQILRGLPADSLVRVVGIMGDARWNELGVKLIEELRLDARLTAFWDAAWKIAPGSTAEMPNLLPRLLNDPLLKNAFFEVAAPDFFKGADEVFAELLVEWIAARPETFGKGTSALLYAAFSKMLSVRTAALRRIDNVGMDLAFALRLLESGLPEVIAKGKTFFESAPKDAPQRVDYLLAICDSPDTITQRYGRDYVRATYDGSVPPPAVVGKLAENPSPLIQELVAGWLANPDARQAVPPQLFDAPILRRRNSGRRVKERVKAELTNSAPQTLDKAVLLEMARSRTKTDADWALQQLARLAISGEEVEGITIEGINGI
jgi:hypothetical protein